MIAPLYKKMAQEQDIEQIVVALTTARTTFEQENIPYISFQDFVDQEPEALTVGAELLTGQYQHPDVPLKESQAYMGLSYLDLVDSQGRDTAKKLFAHEGRKAFLPKRTFKRLFNKLNPDVVVATNSPRAERAAIEAAKESNIPSLCLVDLFTEFELRGFLSDPGYGNKICVFNELAKSILISAGRPESEIEVTGNPGFDSLSSNQNIQAADSYKDRHALKNQTTVLWARSNLPEDLALADLTEKTLIDLALKHPQISVIIRPHPNEPPRVVPSAKNIILSGKADPIAHVLHASDIVCTLYSTVAVEAFLIGKKVLQISGTELFKSFDCAAAGMATEVATMSELENEILKNQTSASWSKRPLPQLDAAGKVKDQILQLLKQERR